VNAIDLGPRAQPPFNSAIYNNNSNQFKDNGEAMLEEDWRRNHFL